MIQKVLKKAIEESELSAESILRLLKGFTFKRNSNWTSLSVQTVDDAECEMVSCLLNKIEQGNDILEVVISGNSITIKNPSSNLVHALRKHNFEINHDLQRALDYISKIPHANVRVKYRCPGIHDKGSFKLNIMDLSEQEVVNISNLLQSCEMPLTKDFSSPNSNYELSDKIILRGNEATRVAKGLAELGTQFDGRRHLPDTLEK